MTRTRIKKRYVVSAFLCLALSLWILSGVLIQWRGRDWINSTLSKQGIDASVQSVKTNFLNKITVSGIDVRSPVVAHADHVVVSVHPWTLPFSQLHQAPFFYVRVLKSEWNLPSNKQNNTPLSGQMPFSPTFPIRISFIDATVKTEWKEKLLELKNAGGDILIAGNIKGQIRGKSPLIGQAQLTFGINPTDQTEWNAQLKTSHSDAGRLVRTFLPDVEQIQSLRGKINTETNLAGQMEPKPGLKTWEVKFKGNELSVVPPESVESVFLSVDGSASASSIHLRGLNMGGIRIAGSIQDPVGEPVLDLKAKAENAPMAPLFAFLVSADKEVGGSATFSSSIKGKPANPVIEATYSYSPVVSDVRFPPLNGTLDVRNKHIETNAAFSDGQVSLAADIKSQESQINVVLEHISLKKWAELNNWKNVSGVFSSAMKFVRHPDDFTATGGFDLEKFTWGRINAKPVVKGTLELTKTKFTVLTDDRSLLVNSRIKNNVFTLQNFHMDVGRGGEINAQGQVQTNGEKLKLTVDAENISPDLWPPIVSRYPDIKGLLNLKGTIAGSIAHPKMELQTEFSELAFLPTGNKWDGSALLQSQSNGFSLKQIRIKGGYEGDVSWFKSGRSGILKTKLALNSANPVLISELLKSTVPVGGQLKGEVSLDIQNSQLVGSSSVTWISPLYGDISFDQIDLNASYDKDRVYVQNAGLIRGAEALHASGSMAKKGEGWLYETNLHLQQWGQKEMRFDGEVRSSGNVNFKTKSVDGVLSAPVLWMQDYLLEDFTAAVRYTPTSFSIEGKSGQEFVFDIKSNQKTGLLNGAVEARGAQIESILPKLWPIDDPQNIPKGKVDGVVRLKGSPAQPHVTVSVKIREGEWRSEAFHGTAALVVTKSTVSITSAQASFEAGGELYLAGDIGLGPDHQIELRGTGTELPLNTVFHLMAWPVKWEGKTDINVEVSGPKNSVVTDITFVGEHEGYGPFKKGGSLSGRVIGQGREWSLSGINVESGDGFLLLKEGSKLYFDKDMSGRMRLIVDVRNLQTGPLTFFGGSEITGTWKDKAIDMDVFGRSLWVNQFVLDGSVTHLNIVNKLLTFSPVFGSGQKLSGVLEYADYPEINVKDFTLVDRNDRSLRLNGLVGPEKWDFSLIAKGVDAGVLRGLFDTTWPMSGPIELDLKGRGSVANPELEGKLVWRNGTIGPLPIDSAQCNILLKDYSVELSKLEAVKKKGYALSGNAKFYLSNPQSEKEDRYPEFDLRVEKGDLALLEKMFSDVRKARGPFQGRFRSVVRKGEYNLSGYFSAQKVVMNTSYTPDLTKGEVIFKLDKNRLYVEQAKAELGRGDVALAGFVDFTNGLPSKFNLSLKTLSNHGAEIRVPQLSINPGAFIGRVSLLKRKLSSASRGEPKLDLTLTGSYQNPLLSGSITMENTVFTYPPTALPGSASNPVTAILRDFKNRMEWNLVLIAGSRTWFQNELVDANVSGQVTFMGPTSDLSVNGRIITEQGSLVYSGNEFSIKRAELDLETKKGVLNEIAPKQTLVYLKANAEREVYYTDSLSNSNQDVIVMVVDRALLGEIQPRFYSKNNPGLSSQRALQLALGLPLNEPIDSNNLLPDQRAQESTSREDTDKMLRLGLIQLLDSNLASPLARAIARQTGLVDYIRVTFQEKDRYSEDPAFAGPEATSSNDVTDNEFLRYAKGTKVKFGRQLSRDFYADYSFRVDETQNQLDLRHEVELAYRLHRNFFLRGVSELDNERSLGRPPDRRAILENQWRFGLPRKKS